MSSSGGIDALLSAMRRKAEEERAGLARETEDRIALLDARLEAELRAAEAEARAALELELEVFAGRLRGEAELAVRMDRLAFKGSVIEEVFAAAEKRLLEGDAGAYGERLARLAVEAVEAIGPPGARLRVRRADAALVEAALAGREAPVEVEGVEAGPGTLQARSPDGRRVVDNSFSTRLERSRALLLPALASLLFAETPAEGPA